MEFEDVRMELLEELVCDSITTLHQREQWYIDNNECCNKKNAYGYDKENKKEYRKQYYKQYYKTHKDKLNEQNKQYRAKKKLVE